MSKYHNIKHNGFDSRKEERRFQELQLLQRAGKITGLKRQVPFVVIPTQYEDGKCIERCVTYKADFTYYEYKDGLPYFVVEDVKGYKAGAAYAIYAIKRKLMLHKYGIRVREV